MFTSIIFKMSNILRLDISKLFVKLQIKVIAALGSLIFKPIRRYLFSRNDHQKTPAL